MSPLPYLSLTVNNYPTWTYADTGNDEDKLLLLEHADGSAVTVLAQDGDYEGLQIQQPDGDWLPVPTFPAPCRSSPARLLTRWTNGLLRPARHRVVAGGTVTRRSTAVFYYPGLDLVLEPLPAFTEPGEETDFEPVTQWDLVKDSVENYLKVFGQAGTGHRLARGPPVRRRAGRQLGGPLVAALPPTSARPSRRERPPWSTWPCCRRTHRPCCGRTRTPWPGLRCHPGGAIPASTTTTGRRSAFT